MLVESSGVDQWGSSLIKDEDNTPDGSHETHHWANISGTSINPSGSLDSFELVLVQGELPSVLLSIKYHKKL